MTEPVVGWRIWKLRGGRLESWAVDYCWEPGENHATCLAPNRHACASSPGRHCQCGFWAVWSPQRCLTRAFSAAEPPWHVMGLIAGWGTVALHDREGFRCEYAALRCLFTDRPWSARVPGAAVGWLFGWWRRRRVGVERAEPDDGAPVDPRRWDAMQAVAARYGVPLVSLESAVNLGLLSELGVPRAQIEEARGLGVIEPGPRSY